MGTRQIFGRQIGHGLARLAGTGLLDLVHTPDPGSEHPVPYSVGKRHVEIVAAGILQGAALQIIEVVQKGLGDDSGIAADADLLLVDFFFHPITTGKIQLHQPPGWAGLRLRRVSGSHAPVAG